MVDGAFFAKIRVTSHRIAMPPLPMTIYALARIETLTIEDLSRASRHGRGADLASKRRRRPDAQERALYLRRTDGGFVRELPKPKPKGDEAANKGDEAANKVVYAAPPAADLLQQHRLHLAREDAGLRQGAAVAMHAQLSVSPEWLGEARFDAKSPAVAKLVRVAVDFAERTFGGVFSARFDVDEESGGGVVDVFSAPIHANARSGRKVVSVRKSIQALRDVAPKRSGKPPKPYTALQDLWHAECQRCLDPGIQRGESVDATERKHLGVDAFKLIRKLERSRDQLGLQAKTAVAAIRQRFVDAGASQDVVGGDPLLRLLNDVVEPDLSAARYRELRRRINAQLAQERRIRRERAKEREAKDRLERERKRWQR